MAIAVGCCTSNQMTEAIIQTEQPHLQSGPHSGPQKRVVLLAGLVLAGLMVAAWQVGGLRHAALLVVGGGLGISLYNARFGFTGAWRALLREHRSSGLRAQLVMIGIAVLLFYPALASGEAFGVPVRGFVAPVGVALLAGAFLFGIGMQLGGGCASGTLFTAGGGSTRMVVTLGAFVVGSLVATHQVGWWWAQPDMGSYSLVNELGLFPGLSATFGILGLIWVVAVMLEKRRHGGLQPLSWRPSNGGTGDGGRPAISSVLKGGQWPLLWAAAALALLNFATLMLAGRPWGITSAFALWGAKGANSIGIDVLSWQYWNGFDGALARSVFFDTTSVMNFGIMAGALLAAGLAGRFSPERRVALRPLMAAIIGGLLLGYGARLAYGCNIGAFFSGTASGSIHGWVWLLAAMAGNSAGARLRPLFALS